MEKNGTFGSNISSGGQHSGPAVYQCDFSLATYEEILISTFLLVVICANVIGNSLVVFACGLSNQLRRRKNTYFIISLAFSDIGFGSMVIPFQIMHKLHGRLICHSLAACYFVNLVDVVFNVSSMLTLFVIAIDRFVAITRPYQYQTIVTSIRAKIIVAVCWGFSLTWSFLGFFKWGKKSENSDDTIWSIKSNNLQCGRMENSYYFAASFIAVYLIPLMVMTVTYGMVLGVAFTQIKAIEHTTVHQDPRITSPNTDNNNENRRKSTVNSRRAKEWKATKSVAIVYLCYLLCWFPLLVLNMIQLFNPGVFQTVSQPIMTFIIYTFIDILPALNTMVNPLIYSFSNKQFRQAFSSVIKKFCRTRKSERSISTSSYSRNGTRMTSVSFGDVTMNHNNTNDNNDNMSGNVRNVSVVTFGTERSYAGIVEQQESVGVDNSCYEAEKEK